MNNKIWLLIALLCLMIPIGISFSQSVNGIVTGVSPPSTPNITASIQPNVQPSQTEVFTATANGGIAPFTYNFQIINTVTDSFITNMLVSNALDSNTFSWLVPSFYYGNTIKANITITDSFPTTVNSIYTEDICIGCTSPSSNGIIDIQPDVVVFANNWLAIALFTLAVALFVIRMVLFNEKAIRFTILDILSAAIMVFAFYFFVFSPVAVTNVLSVTTNASSSGNVIGNSTIVTQTAHVPFASTGFILLVTFLVLWVILMFLFAIYDFIKASGIF